MLQKLPERDADSHKGTYGRALLIGGSRGMAGSIALSALATLRSGAGLVTAAVPDCCLETVAGFDPCFMTIGLPRSDGRISSAAESEIIEYVQNATCIAIGPGLGTSDELIQLVVSLYESVDKPMVVDADALNCLAKHGVQNLKPGGTRILTPHPGEFARLTGNEAVTPDERKPAAIDFANSTGTIVLLKGAQTVVSDGQQHYRNKTGNPGMATGGSGDVLTGVITALVCQGMEPFPAACTGAHLHGKAGDFAAEVHGQVGMTARDIIHALPAAFKSDYGESRRIGFPI